MQTKLSRAKTGVLLQLVFLLTSITNAHSFSKKIFEKLNTHFESIGLNRSFDSIYIKNFQENSVHIGGLNSSLKNIPLPYFVFSASKKTTETVLWVGGIHPDELAALNSSLALGGELVQNLQEFKLNKNIVYVPLLNVDGLLKGIEARNYGLRNNGINEDVNRTFYAYDEINYRSNNEVEFIISLIKKYNPKFWVIPHSAIHILDFDGLYDSLAIGWLNDIHKASTINGGREIPIKRHGNFSPPNSKINWSIGKLASHLGDVRSLTFEFPGPGEYPERGHPDRARIITLRKQLGRFEDTAWLAEQYYYDYKPALLKSLFIEETL